MCAERCGSAWREIGIYYAATSYRTRSRDKESAARLRASYPTKPVSCVSARCAIPQVKILQADQERNDETMRVLARRRAAVGAGRAECFWCRWKCRAGQAERGAKECRKTGGARCDGLRHRARQECGGDHRRAGSGQRGRKVCGAGVARSPEKKRPARR